MPNPEPNNTSAHGRPGDPCVFVIFGATGDLTKRLLMPSLYNLLANKLLPDKFAIVGVSNVQMSSEDFRKQLGEEIKQFATTKVSDDLWKFFDQRISYMAGDFKDPATYTKLKSALETADKAHGTPGNYLFYTAVSPSFFGEIVKQLAGAGLTKETDGHWRRVIIEKPFGHDLESANALNREIGACIHENQTFRIDHYLGKETVQNIMAFRFGNGFFEPLWNNSYIDHVQITDAETVGVEHRGTFYEATGALRDMVPNHIMALVSLVAMEPPNSFESEPVRDEKTKVLRAIRPLKPEDVPSWAVRGQYGPGTLEGKPVPGYRAEPQVNPKSGTETYVALKLAIDNWRWAGVPIYLRTGKRMAKRVTEIAIKFKAPPALLFRQTGVKHLEQNELVLHIQPERRHLAQLQRQDSRAGGQARRRRYEFQVRGLLRLGAEHAVTRRCCSIACSAILRCFSALTRSTRDGASSIRSWTHGNRLRRPTSRTMQPVQPDRARPTSCSNATAANGDDI